MSLRIICFFLVFVLPAISLQCQSVSGLKKQAEQLEADGDLEKARSVYKDLVDYQPTKVAYREKLAALSLETGHYQDAYKQGTWLLINKKRPKANWLKITAEALYHTGQFMDAAKYYKSYLTVYESPLEAKEVELKLLRCESGVVLQGKKERASLFPYPANINSSSSEVCAFYKDSRGGTLLMVRRSGNESTTFELTGESEGRFRLLPVQSEDPGELLIGTDPTGQQSYWLHKSLKKMGIDSQGTKVQTIPLPLEMNTGSLESMHTRNGKFITYTYRTAQGDTNIKLLKWSPQDGWIESGIFEHINTSFDETGARFYPEKGLLIFSSNRPGSIGGYDLFFSTYSQLSNTWSGPKSLGLGINSIYDEIGLELRADNREAIIASNRTDRGENWDLFRVFFNDLADVPLGDAISSSE